jgi:hypothetical protein
MSATLTIPQADTAIPVARAHLVRGATCWRWVVDRCPHCGKRHGHGGGELAGDPRRYLTHRVADCGADGGYTLVEAE